MDTNVDQTSEKPRIKIKKLIVIALVSVFCLAALSFASLRSDIIKKMINHIFPGKSWTIEYFDKSLSQINQYKTSIIAKNKNGELKAEGVVLKNGNFSYDASIPFSVSRSKVINNVPLNRRVVRQDGSIYISDDYDNTYHKIETDMISADSILPLTDPIFNTVTTSLNAAQDIKVIKESAPDGVKIFRITTNNVSPELSSLLGITDPNVKAEIIVDLEQKTYLPKRMSIMLQDQDYVEITQIFSGFNEDFSVNDADISEKLNDFGSFASRESLYIRTDDNGQFDDLWFEWEKKYFLCDHCVNRYGDKDGDGIRNISEFIIGSNPIESDTNSNGSNDSNEIERGYSPVYLMKIPPVYLSGINTYIEKQNREYRVGATAGDDTEAGNLDVRSSSIYQKVDFPTNAEFLQLNYKFFGDNKKDYLCVFLDDELLFKDFPSSNQDSKEPVIPIINFAGRSGNLMIILNSVGPPKQSELLVGNISTLTKK